MTVRTELDAAIQIASESAELVRSYFGTDRINVQAKGIGDVVTAADTASEALVLRRLAESFPRDGVVGEEGASRAGTSGRMWYVDPLDGTLNFSRSIPLWCVSIALYAGDQAILGVVHDPIVGETFSAGSGLGSFCGTQSIQCSGITSASESVVHLTVDLKDLGATAGLDDIAVIAPRVLRTRNIGSAALALAYVAAGRFDAMLHRFAHPWDYAAGVLLVREAGGIVTDMRGEDYTPHTHHLCAAAGSSVHSELLAMVSGAAELPAR